MLVYLQSAPVSNSWQLSSHYREVKHTSVNEVMDEEEQGRQVIMVHGKAKTVRDVIEEIRKKAKDNTRRDFSEG